MKGTPLRPYIAAVVLAAVLRTCAVQAQDAAPVYTIQVDGLACPFCAYGIEKQLGAIEGVESIEIDIRSGSVKVTVQAGAILEEERARRAVEAAGFTMGGFEAPGTRE